MVDEVRFQRVTSTRAAQINPVLGLGEPTYEKDTGKFKIGDGVTAWNDLPYYTPGVGGGPTSEELLEHINDPSPHDSGFNYVLFYENAKV